MGDEDQGSPCSRFSSISRWITCARTDTSSAETGSSQTSPSVPAPSPPRSRPAGAGHPTARAGSAPSSAQPGSARRPSARRAIATRWSPRLPMPWIAAAPAPARPRSARVERLVGSWNTICTRGARPHAGAGHGRPSNRTSPRSAAQPEQHPPQRRLATARLAHDAQHLAAVPGQVDAVQRPHQPAACGGPGSAPPGRAPRTGAPATSHVAPLPATARTGSDGARAAVQWALVHQLVVAAVLRPVAARREPAARRHVAGSGGMPGMAGASSRGPPTAGNAPSSRCVYGCCGFE